MTPGFKPFTKYVVLCLRDFRTLDPSKTQDPSKIYMVYYGHAIIAAIYKFRQNPLPVSVVGCNRETRMNAKFKS